MSTSISSSSSSAMPFQEYVGDFYSRRLLLQHTTPLYQSPAPGAAAAGNGHNMSEPYTTGDNTFDANVVMVLSVLLCALICSLGLNSIVRCALRCSSLLASSSSESISTTTTSARLATTGVKRKALKTFPTLIYSAGLNLPGLDSECAICLSEFTAGERVRILPKCNHGFHVRCIDKWLGSHSSCPTCRHCLIETCQKIVGCSQLVAVSTSAPSSPPLPPPPPPPPQENIIVTIAPLAHEGLVRDYRGIN